MGVIGVDDNADRGDCASTIGAEVDSILVKAIQAGKSVGLITTARLTHATPSALYAHVPERDWEANSDIPATQSGCKDIALQFLENLDTKHVKVALGGGRKKFMPNTKKDPESGKPGSRTDGRDLTEEWVTSRSSLGKATYVWNQTAFDAVDPNEVDYLFGLFQDSHMQYDIHRPQDKSGEPSLEEMTEKAIQILQKNPKGFFLLVEGGRIDHGHHEGRANLALTDAIAMDKAVTKAKSMTSSTETLTIVTADHSHTMSMVGYPSRGNPILGHAAEDGVDSLGNDNLPYTTLSYANGPGAPAVKEAFTNTGDRPDIENVDTGSDGYLQQSLVPMKYETHAGDDVGIWADGPLAHLFHSTHEQHYIMHVMAYAACIDESKSHCKPRRRI